MVHKSAASVQGGGTPVSGFQGIPHRAGDCIQASPGRSKGSAIWLKP